jgi:hypothetical protein
MQARKAVGARTLLRQVDTLPGICEIYHKNNLRHADTKMENVSNLM